MELEWDRLLLIQKLNLNILINHSWKTDKKTITYFRGKKESHMMLIIEE